MTQPELIEPEKPSLVRDVKKLAKWSSVIGVILGIVCHFVPPDYQSACHSIIAACNAK